LIEGNRYVDITLDTGNESMGKSMMFAGVPDARGVGGVSGGFAEGGGGRVKLWPPPPFVP